MSESGEVTQMTKALKKGICIVCSEDAGDLLMLVIGLCAPPATCQGVFWSGSKRCSSLRPNLLMQTSSIVTLGVNEKPFYFNT